MAEEEETSLDEIARQVLRDCECFHPARLLHTQAIAGDASGRQYVRLFLDGVSSPSIVLILHRASRAPALSGRPDVSQEEAFVILARYLGSVGIPVPQVFHHDPKRHLILCEDLGDQGLWKFAKGELDTACEGALEKLGSDYLFALFKRAVDLIARLQRIPHDKDSLAFQRFLTFETYRREIAEFSEHFGRVRGLRRSAAEALNRVYDGICETIVSFPKSLSYFDFNAFNLLVDSAGELRVIDFQDACLVSSARDIVSLINDRGMDETLGKSMHARLIKFYFETLKPGPDFHPIYNFTLLHWDLRVSGRYEKLCCLQKTDRYRQWLPGTLRRLGRTLIRCYASLPGLETLLEIASEISPEVREGVEDPWPLPDR